MNLEQYLKIAYETHNNCIRLQAYPSYTGGLIIVAHAGNLKGEGKNIQKALEKLNEKLNHTEGNK